MIEKELNAFLLSIEPASAVWLARAQERQQQLTKPPGSLGRLEEIANRVCAMGGTLSPLVERAAIFVFAADHGVCAEGVNAYPQSVTRGMVSNFLKGGAAINALAESVGAHLTIVDMGVIGGPFDHPSIVNSRLGECSGNICQEPAMTIDQALAGIAAGVECAEQAASQGFQLLAFGEMGIGNTTIASALCTAITTAAPEQVCGRGTSVDDSMLVRKQVAVRRAIQLHMPHIVSPLHLICRLGGFEIAAMCGFCIGAASRKLPLLVDGFIASAAAAIAVCLNSSVGDYLIAAHRSSEPGHSILLEFLHLRPLLDLDMRLGEGTGAAVAIPVVQAAVSAFRNMATFESAGVAQAISTE